MQVVVKCSGTLRNYGYHLLAQFMGAIYRCYLRVPFAGTIYVCHLQAPLRAPFTVTIYGYHLQVQSMGAIYERHLGAIYGCHANHILGIMLRNHILGRDLGRNCVLGNMYQLLMLIFLLINRFKNDDLLLLFNTLAITQVIITENRLRVLDLMHSAYFLVVFLILIDFLV